MSNIRLRDIEGYESFKAECEFFKCKEEYPGWTGVEKYGIFSSKSLEELKGLYPKVIQAMSPVLIMSPKFAEPMNESISNTRKHNRIQTLYCGSFEYNDDLEYSDAQVFFDPSDFVLSLEMKEALAILTELQRKRIEMYFFQKMTFREIAEIEGVSDVSVRESINYAIKNLQNYFDVPLSKRL